MEELREEAGDPRHHQEEWEVDGDWAFRQACRIVPPKCEPGHPLGKVARRLLGCVLPETAKWNDSTVPSANGRVNRKRLLLPLHEQHEELLE